MDKEKMMAAIMAIRSGYAPTILDTVSALDDGERLCVEMVLELTAPPAKKRRSDAGTKRTKGATG